MVYYVCPKCGWEVEGRIKVGDIKSEYYKCSNPECDFVKGEKIEPLTVAMKPPKP